MSVAGAREVRFERFGGLNLRDDDIADHEARDMLNMVGRPRGGVRTRDGSSLFAQSAVGAVMPSGGRFLDLWPVGYQKTTALKSIGGGQVNKEAKPALFGIIIDTSDPFTASLATRAVSIFGDGTIADHGAIALFSNVVGQFGNGRFGVATGPSGIYLLSTGTGNSYVIGAASDTPASWSASAGTLPRGNLVKWWSGRMLASGLVALPARVAASAIGDPLYWSTTASGTGQQGWTVDLEPGDGDVIVGWAAVDSYVLIFKRRRIWAIYDGDTGANRVLSPDIGATSRYAIAETPYGVAFQAGDYSIWLASGTSVKRISDKVAPLCISAGAVGYAADHLYVSMPGMGTLDYDFTTDEWRRHSLLANQFARQDFDDGAGQKLFGLSDPSVSGHNVLRYLDPARTDDAGAPFYSFWATAHRKFGTEVLKRITELRVEGTGTVDVTFNKERQGDTFQRTVSLGSTWGQGAVLTPGKARSWGFRFQNNSAPFSLDAYAVNLRAAKS